MEYVEWGDELQGEALDHEWRSAYDDRQCDDEQLYGRGGDERDDVLLRGVGGEHGGRECQFEPGECDTAGGNAGFQHFSFSKQSNCEARFKDVVHSDHHSFGVVCYYCEFQRDRITRTLQLFV